LDLEELTIYRIIYSQLKSIFDHIRCFEEKRYAISLRILIEHPAIPGITIGAVRISLGQTVAPKGAGANSCDA